MGGSTVSSPNCTFASSNSTESSTVSRVSTRSCARNSTAGAPHEIANEPIGPRPGDEHLAAAGAAVAAAAAVVGQAETQNLASAQP
jgi:hypothetical protein